MNSYPPVLKQREAKQLETLKPFDKALGQDRNLKVQNTVEEHMLKGYQSLDILQGPR